MLVPSPDVILPLVTSGAGDLELPFITPSGIPNGAALILQHWISDASNAPPFSASNGLRGDFYDLEQ